MKKINLKIKSVIFDMDGVITNTMPEHFLAWKTVLAPQGVQVSHFDVYRREGQRGINSVEEIFAEKKKPYTPRLAKALLRKKEEFFKKIVKRRFIPGMRSFIRFLKKEHYQLGLVTGTSRHELHRILPDYIYNLFDVTIAGDEVKNGKPHPEPYLLALKKLRITPQQAVVIENAPFGIQAAKAAGVRCLAIATSLPKKYLKQADYVFRQLQDLRRRVNFIHNGHPQK